MGPKAYSGPENLELRIQELYCPLAQRKPTRLPRPSGVKLSRLVERQLTGSSSHDSRPQCFSAFSFSAFASLMTLSAMKAGTSS